MSLLLEASLAADGLNSVILSYERSSKENARLQGPFLADLDPRELIEKIAGLRRVIGEKIALCPARDAALLPRLDNIHLASGRLRGILFAHKLKPKERATVARYRTIFERNWRSREGFRAFCILSFYVQPFELPLQTDIGRLDDAQLRRYLYFTMRQPQLMRIEDEALYLRYYGELTNWLLTLLDPKTSPLDAQRRDMAAAVVRKMLTFGTCYYLDSPTGELVRARGRIVHAVRDLLPAHAAVKDFPRGAQPAAGRRKIRLGIISRNVGDWTDTRALFGMFGGFDPDLYELYWYSLDITDATANHDVGFYRKLFARVHKVASLRRHPSVNARTVLADDLDMLVIGSAYSYGVDDYDMMLSYRMARVQIGFNPLVPGSSGLPSYDYYIAPPADAEAMENFRAEATEELRIMPDPLVWYDKRPASVPDGTVTRRKLGIPAKAVLYFSGAAANKQVPGTMRAWLEILRRTPGSYLMLMPFNPGWGGYYIGLTFLNRLRLMLRDYPDIDPARIKIIREVTPAEGNQLLLLADIYLGSFPHGGATSAMLALRHGVPVVARRSLWLRGTSDPSLLKSIGLDELIGADTQGFIEIAARLGQDAGWRRAVKARIAARIDNAPFLDPAGCSRRLQQVFDDIAAARGLLPQGAKAKQGATTRTAKG